MNNINAEPSMSIINMLDGSLTLYREKLKLGQSYHEVEKTLQKHVSRNPHINTNGIGSWNVEIEQEVLLYNINSTCIELTFRKFKLAGVKWILNGLDYTRIYGKSRDLYKIALYEQFLLLENMEQSIGAPTTFRENEKFSYITGSYFFVAALDKDLRYCYATFEDRELYGQ